MKSSLTQQQLQEQQQLQQQRLTAQQILQVRLLEMPLAQIEQAVKAELCDNPALESDRSEDPFESGDTSLPADSFTSSDSDTSSSPDDDAVDNADYEAERDREDREDALDAALESMAVDDRTDVNSDYRTSSDYSAPDADQEEIVYGQSQSFYDKLMQQVADEDLTERQREIMDYLVGSLDGDGLLRKDLIAISDELAIYHSIDATEDEIEHVLNVLQSFEPAGVGGRNLQECLLLQIFRRENSQLQRRMALVIARHFDDFTHKRWERIRQHMRLTTEQAERVIRELRRLNPRPGASLGETMGRNTQQVTPDFIVETTDDGVVTFSLNRGEIPSLHVSYDFEQQLQGYQNNKESLNRMQKEALLYTKEKVERARGFIDAVKRRRETMVLTMRAIIDIQHRFFQEGDESDLVPMTLKDVADRIGMDISTVSRVCNSKYADTRWGIFRLRHFFSEGYSVQETGEELSTRKIKVALRDIIDAENKRSPLSDEAIARQLKAQGFPIARRTVSKYREQLGIPVARLRK